MKRPASTILALLLLYLGGICGEPLRLDAGNFELAVQTYRHLAVLFYDQTPISARLIRKWTEASNVARASGSSVGFATIDANLPDVDELVETSGIKVPAVRLFRRGLMFDFNLDPHDSAEKMAMSVLQEAQPAVTPVSSYQEVEDRMGKGNLVVLGFFDQEEVEESAEGSGGTGPYSAFQSAADTLKGYADFLVAEGEELDEAFAIMARPTTLYLGKESIEDGIPYQGEWSEEGLSEWLLGQDVPAFGELSRHDEKADMYANKFFNSALPKFIVFTEGLDTKETRAQLQHMARVAEHHRGAALFAHCVHGSFPEVTDFFRVQEADLPALIYWNPQTEAQLLSPSPTPLEQPDLELFVEAVLAGEYIPTPRTETEPKVQKGPVMKLVGSTFTKVVSQSDKDVLVLATQPLCPRCLEAATSFELLAKALQADDRVVLAKIDVMLNDLPPSIAAVDSPPALLWFPSNSKPFDDGAPMAKRYPGNSFNLADLLSFVNKENSFGKDSLRLATHEQLGALAVDDQMVREALQVEEMKSLRNYMRKVYDNVALDWLAGDIIFDGHRWHLAALALSILANLVLLVIAASSAGSLAEINKRKGRRKGGVTEEDNNGAEDDGTPTQRRRRKEE